MGTASVTISVKDDATTQIRGIATELQKLQALAKALGPIAGGTLGPNAGGGVPGAGAGAVANGAAELLRAAGDLSAAAAALTASAGAHATAMKQVVQQVKNPAAPPAPAPGQPPKPPAPASANQGHGMLSAFASNAGGGTAMSLVGLAGPLAFAAALGAVVANSVRLAVEFNRVSTAAVFGMTSNAADLLSNLESFKSAAYGMTDIGIGPSEAARMMGAYAMASGRDAANVVGESRDLGEWAKARGLDPVQFGQQAAIIGQNASPDVNKNMGQIFGAASQEGDFGRRQTEMLGTIASLLAKNAAMNPGGQPSLTDALREITGVTSLGGYYATTQGAAATLSAQQAFGGSDSMADMQLESAAGWSPEKMLVGPFGPEDVASKARTLYRQTEGVYAHGTQAQKDLGRYEMEARLRLKMPGEQAHALAVQMERNGGELLGGAITPADKAASIDAFKQSPAGIAQATAANFEAAQTKMGDDIVKHLGPIAKGVSDLVEKVGLANVLLGAIAGFAAVQAIGSAGGIGGVLGKLGGLGRFGAMAVQGMGALGMAGVVGAGVLATGAFVLGTQSPAGDADESSPDAAWRAKSNAKSDRAGGAGAGGGSLSGNARSKMAYLRNLWVRAGGDPKAADQMALVAMNESGGDPSIADGVTGTHIGLWQISQSYSHGNLRDPLLNAQVAVRLYKARVAAHDRPLGDWDDSMYKGAYGGWKSDRTQRELEGPEPATTASSTTKRTSYVRTPTHDVQVSVVVTPKDNSRVAGGTSRTGAYTA